MVHNPGRVITEMERKVWSVMSGEREKMHTVVMCVSQQDYNLSIPPMIIYPCGRLAEELKAGAHPSTLFACSKSGGSHRSYSWKVFGSSCAQSCPLNQCY